MIRVYVERRDYGNELAVWILDERLGDGRTWIARIEDGLPVFHPHDELGVMGEPTLRLHAGIPDAFFGALEGYRDRNLTAETVLGEALADARATRDRLLTIVEQV